MNRIEVLWIATWLVPLALTYVLIARRRRTRRLMTAVLLAVAWNAWAVLAVNAVAIEMGWWTFGPGRTTFVGVPIEAWAGWTLLWGAVAPLLALRQPLAVTLVAFLWLDLIAMPWLEPVVVLRSSWVLGELIAIGIGLLPALLLFRWTLEGRNLSERASLQVICAGALLLWLVPSIAFHSNGGWDGALDVASWRLSLVSQLVLVAAGLGVRAVMEFVERGRGTPLPYDPPERLVTSGPYSYLRNPMQSSMVLVFALAAVVLWNQWLLAAAVIALVYGAGLAEWHESIELSERYGEHWATYRARVRPWLPTLRPTITDEATLLVAYSCQTCSSIGRWFRSRDPIGLVIAPAEDSRDPGVRRVTYLPAHGPPSRGVAAIARALEHIHLGWALVGWLLALPGIVHFAQLLADVFGPTPHPVAGLPYDRAACDAHRTPVAR